MVLASGKDQKKRLGEFLREKREKAGLAQADVAHRIGLKSAQSISNIERGIASPELRSFQGLLKIYKIPKNEAKAELMKYYAETIEKVVFGKLAPKRGYRGRTGRRGPRKPESADSLD